MHQKSAAVSREENRESLFILTTKMFGRGLFRKADIISLKANLFHLIHLVYTVPVILQILSESLIYSHKLKKNQNTLFL